MAFVTLMGDTFGLGKIVRDIVGGADVTVKGVSNLDGRNVGARAFLTLMGDTLGLGRIVRDIVGGADVTVKGVSNLDGRHVGAR
ncbi:hypothetical protein J6590_054650 [Homalodisca vitripennis]|nr:hypothetical protein J6590_054650 [Homalodisca vitripennis]